MGLNSTVSADRLHIGFFGMRNAGKSSVVNRVTNQQLSVVSDVKGTTTDPVKKAMELLPIGPVVIIDTPGLDDEGDLGQLRVKKAKQVLLKTDIAVLVADASRPLDDLDNELIATFKEKKIPYVIAYNKSDLLNEKKIPKDNEIYISALTGENIDRLKDMIAALVDNKGEEKHIIADKLSPGDMVVLVIPIDEAAPKGRLILPQQQTMRDILDAHCSFVACQETELEATLKSLSKKPKLVITDSQVFKTVAQIVPDDIMLTSFSVLFARYKGDLAELAKGAAALSGIKDGDKILISEGCTHHRQCGDIGSVKIPALIRKHSGANPIFEFTSGGEFPESVEQYSLIVHCGGCMLNDREMANRIDSAKRSGIPVVNYGLAIAEMTGILKRSLEPFKEV